MLSELKQRLEDNSLRGAYDLCVDLFVDHKVCNGMFESYGRVLDFHKLEEFRKLFTLEQQTRLAEVFREIRFTPLAGVVYSFLMLRISRDISERNLV